MSISAAMDLGSHTLRLLVARVMDNGFEALERGLAFPRLGTGLKPGGRLALKAKKAALNQAGIFVETARRLGAERVALAATQACRVAIDGPEFVAFLGRELGLDKAVVLSGEQEAGLSRLGVLSRLEGSAQGAFVVDVGGGSTEIMDLGSDPGPGLSLKMGAVSLTETLIRNDPPQARELSALESAVDEGLRLLGPKAAARLVATSGTATTLVTLRLGMEAYEPDRIDNCRVGLAEIREQYARLAGLTIKDRRKVKGLEPERAEIILAGIAILIRLIQKLGLDELTVMDAGLLEGILLADNSSSI